MRVGRTQAEHRRSATVQLANTVAIELHHDARQRQIHRHFDGVLEHRSPRTRLELATFYRLFVCM